MKSLLKTKTSFKNRLTFVFVAAVIMFGCAVTNIRNASKPVSAEGILNPEISDSVIADSDPADYDTIASDSMKVLIDKEYPSVFKYKTLDDRHLANGVRKENLQKRITINGMEVAVTSTKQTELEADYAVYEIAAIVSGSVPANAVFTVKLSVKNFRLKMEFINIVEKSGRVATFFLPNHRIISMKGEYAGAAVSQLTGWGPMRDTFIYLNDWEFTSTKRVSLSSYALMFDGVRNAAAIESNVEDGKNKYFVDAVYNGENDKFVAFTSSAWYWHYYPEVPMIDGYVPYSEVIIDGDLNNDAKITWQDAGLAYRKIMRRPLGADDTKDYWSYIAMNMSSQAENPSLRILDRAKAISYLTDGFGQKIMNKGYQEGGHDDSQGNYASVSSQQGGVEDFNFLIEKGKEYNIKMGIHINATEYALDGFELKAENMSGYGTSGLVRGWSWLDQSYYVNKSLDLRSGELKRRIDQLGATLPDLDFVYIDVWQSYSKYEAKMLAYYLNQYGYSIATEALGDFEEDITFVHWNTDLYYSVGGTQSEVMRFVQNDIADKFASDRALLGLLMPGVSDWRDHTDFQDAERVFYRNNLATKYLQHFELLEWEPHKSARFTGGVRTFVEQVGSKFYNNIYKDEKLIARLDVSSVKVPASGYPNSPGKAEIFIPYGPQENILAEDKIYFYSDYSVNETDKRNRTLLEKEWQLPNSWSGVSTVYQYELTTNGRVFVQELAVNNGKVTPTGSIETPYLITAVRQDACPDIANPNGRWGEGSHIKNFGFSSGNFESWKVEAKTGDVKEIKVVTEEVVLEPEQQYIDGKWETVIVRNVNPILGKDPVVSFGAGVAGKISQVMTGLTPGQTYSISAWTTTDSRNARLGVIVDGVDVFTTLKSTAGIPVSIYPSKYLRKEYQRMKIDITVPTGVTTAKVYFSVDAGSSITYLDDFRCWEWQTEKAERGGEYIVYEDFENSDENWGPFVSQIGGQPFIHLVYRNPAGGQIKYYTLDNGGLVSLKDQQEGTGVHMRTLPSTLNFVKGGNYTVSFDYSSFHEHRGDSTDISLYGGTSAHAGYNVELKSPKYSVELRNSAKQIISQYELRPSTITGTGYNARPSVENIEFNVLPGSSEGLYITISKISADSGTMLIIDNFKVKRNDFAIEGYMKETNGEVMLKLSGTLPQDISKNDFSGTIQIGDEDVNELTINSYEYVPQYHALKFNFDTIPLREDSTLIKIIINYGENAYEGSILLGEEGQRELKELLSKTGIYNDVKKYTAASLASYISIAEQARELLAGGNGTSDEYEIYINMINDAVKTLVVNSLVSYDAPKTISVEFNKELGLAEQIEVMRVDGTTVMLNVKYYGYSSTRVGTYIIFGVIDTADEYFVGRVFDETLLPYGMQLKDQVVFERTFEVEVTVAEGKLKGCEKPVSAKTVAIPFSALVGVIVFFVSRKKLI